MLIFSLVVHCIISFDFLPWLFTCRCNIDQKLHSKLIGHAEGKGKEEVGKVEGGGEGGGKGEGEGMRREGTGAAERIHKGTYMLMGTSTNSTL